MTPSGPSPLQDPAVAPPDSAVVDLYLMSSSTDRRGADELASWLVDRLDAADLPTTIRRVAVMAIHPDAEVATTVFTFRRADDDGRRPYWMPGCALTDPQRFAEDRKFRSLHPMISRRLQMWRLANFDIFRLASVDDVYAYDCVARENPADRRLVAVAEIRGMTPVRDDSGRAVAIPEVELALAGCLDAIRSARANDHRVAAARLEPRAVVRLAGRRPAVRRDQHDRPSVDAADRGARTRAGRGQRPTADADVGAAARGGHAPRLRAGHGLTVRITEPPTSPMQPLDDYTRKRIQPRRRGLVHPYELAPLLAGRGGTFVEHDLDADGRLDAVVRPPGHNGAGVVVGVVNTPSVT